jgi:multiple sugar transport system substrate-binding protein
MIGQSQLFFQGELQLRPEPSPKAGSASWTASNDGSPNRLANEVYFRDFYEKNPNNYTAVKQLSTLTKWYAFPGENGLKITDVIKDHMNSIVTGKRAGEPQSVLADMTSDMQKLLPKKAN